TKIYHKTICCIMIDSIDTKDKKEWKCNLTFKGLIIKPLILGMWGFVGFLIVLVLAKYLGYMVGTLTSFRIEGEDFLLCFLGFILSFLVKFLGNFQDSESKD
ncbi:MAG: hypothetical protein ACYC56_14835, partial [Candidatus Aquicultor sp.]